MGNGENGESSFLRQLSLGGGGGGSGWKNYSSPSSYYCSRSTTKGDGGSKRWGGKKSFSCRQMEEEEEEVVGGVGGGSNNINVGMGVMKKRVMVLIDDSSKAKQAMMWALTHITNKADLLTLLHVITPHQSSSSSSSMEDAPNLANSLGSLCKACKPQVEVEALVIQGPKLATVLSQVKKLEATVLVLSQSNPSPFCCLFRSSNEEFVEQCINKAECLTVAVKKQSKGIGGYLVSTRWQKNFWLLA